MADFSECLNTTITTVSGLLACIARVLGITLPAQSDFSPGSAMFNFFGLKVRRAEPKDGYALYAEVEPAWQGFPVGTLKSLYVYVRDTGNSRSRRVVPKPPTTGGAS